MHQEPSIRAGVFTDVRSADAAVAALVDAGFPTESISVVCPRRLLPHFEQLDRQEPAGAHTPAAVAVGGAIGSLLGGLSAAAGALAAGGTGLLFVGPLLAGIAGGGVTGGFLGAMATRGIEGELADFYDQALRRGRILIAVGPALERGPSVPPLSEAERIFARTGAETVELHGD